MASKNFLSTLARKIKENKGSIAICSILFIIPLFVFPTYPKNEWQYEIYQYITQIMHVTIGTKGPLPFFYDSLQPLYNHSHVYCWLCYMLFFY